MIRGCELDSPGRRIATDRMCCNWDFCEFYNSDAWSDLVDKGIVQKSTMREGMLKCIRCNSEIHRNNFEIVNWATIRISRDKQCRT